MNDEVAGPVRVFIGSGETSVLACRTLIFSLRRHTRRPLDVWVFNGTHNAVEHDGDPPVLTSLPLRLKYRQKTEFSLYRYLIPQLCGYKGRAIYLDSDMVCLGDIGELFDTPLEGCDFLAKQDAYGEGHWTSSVMLLDCSRARFDLEGIFDEIDRGAYRLRDFHQFSPAFRRHRSYSIGVLDPRWNEFDRHDSGTKLIHYTAMATQPWKRAHHPYGDIWFEYFNAAMSEGVINRHDVQLSIERGVVRPDILDGNHPVRMRVRRRVRRTAGRLLSWAGVR